MKLVQYRLQATTSLQDLYSLYQLMLFKAILLGTKFEIVEKVLKMYLHLSIDRYIECILKAQVPGV